jgi:hypothetical protein
MGLSITKPYTADVSGHTTGAASMPSSTGGIPASRRQRASTATGVLAGLPTRGSGDFRQPAARRPDAWSAVAAHIHNPGEDARVSSLIGMLQTLHQASPTFRSRLNKMAREGGVTITVADKDTMPRAFTHPGLRRIHLSAEIVTDSPESAHQSLPALAVEISNLCRRDEFDTVNRHFHHGRLDIQHAARLKETAEYGSVGDMVRYFAEARRTLEQMGFGNPSLWYARIGPFKDVRAAYPTVNDYLKATIQSGHTAAYERQFANIAAKMARDK